MKKLWADSFVRASGVDVRRRQRQNRHLNAHSASAAEKQFLINNSGGKHMDNVLGSVLRFPKRPSRLCLDNINLPYPSRRIKRGLG
jgi:hypothetical protein